MKFTPDISFSMSKIFQEDISLLGVLFEIGAVVFVGVIRVNHSFALENFRVSLGFFKSFYFSNIVYSILKLIQLFLLK